jgi:hypothetical protein
MTLYLARGAILKATQVLFYFSLEIATTGIYWYEHLALEFR